MNIYYKFVSAALLTASKTAIYRMVPTRPSSEPSGDKADRQDTSGNTSIGVHPEQAKGKFYQTDLSIGTTEGANELVLTDAICSVSMAKNIVRTSLVGLSGTIKEYINNGDYEITIQLGLVAIEEGKIIDKYPAEGVQDLRDLLDKPQSLYVISDFLQLFDITKFVIVDYTIEQMTHSNYQMVSIRAASDEDYTIKYNEY